MGVKNLKKRIITTGDRLTGSHDLFTVFLMLTVKDIKYICVVRKRSVAVVSLGKEPTPNYSSEVIFIRDEITEMVELSVIWPWVGGILQKTGYEGALTRKRPLFKTWKVTSLREVATVGRMVG